jgi:4-diphosphocytidyl-2-C-methyl-D-erythritol kinase
MIGAPAAGRRWFAPAKLNLYLHVTGRRADGFHRIDGLLAFAAIGDAVTVAPAPTITTTTTLALAGPFAGMLGGGAEDNLVWRAAEALARRQGVTGDAAITLTKNLPVASGIGGGSSDAAATLRALAGRWGETDCAALDEVARSLGSDVPACLLARPCWLGGIGDRVEPAGALPRCGVVLVNPLIPLPTAKVYRGFGGPFSPPARFAVPADATALAALLADRRNDLTESAIARAPIIADILERLAGLEHCLLARMSGSGATCFALFPHLADAEAAAVHLRHDAPHWWIAATRLMAADDALSDAPSGESGPSF